VNKKTITFNKQRGIYIAQLYVGGKRIRKKLGDAAEFVGMSPQERSVILSDRLEALRLELGLQSEGGMVTLKSAVERFLAHCETRNSARTVYTYGDSLKRWQQANGNPCVEDYQRSQLDRYIAQERERGLNDRTINHHIRNVNRFYSWAYEEELISKPVKLKQLRAVTVVPQTWSREQLELMREYIERKLTETGSRRFLVLRRAFFLFRYTGMRASELINLRWDHILPQGIWLESTGDWQTKGRRDAILPVAKPLRQFLNAEGHDGEVYVCDDGSGGKYWRDYSSAGHSFQKMLDQLGLKGPKVLHGFRATVATELLAAGESPVLVQKLLRHQQLTTTLGYLNVGEVEVQELVNKL
jgi:integrase